jgi:hypothetical protein
MNEYLYKNKPNEFLCYILLLFIRKILIESDEKWYIKIIKTPDLFPYIDFFEIKLLLIKLLKIYIFHIINTTLILTDLKIVLIRFFGNELIEQIKEDLQKNIQNGGISQLENVQTFNKQFNEPVYKLVQLEKFKHFEEFKQLEEFKQFEKKIKNEIKEKSSYYLSKLIKINNYFQDEKHEYLLNSNMEPEIIRKIKDEKNIIDVFNILKDILQLSTDLEDYEYI